MRESLLLADLRRPGVDEYLRRPADGKPTASAISLAIVAAGGRRWQPRLIASTLAAAGIMPSRRAPNYGFDPAEILAALRDGGGLDTLEKQLMEVNAV